MCAVRDTMPRLIGPVLTDESSVGDCRQDLVTIAVIGDLMLTGDWDRSVDPGSTDHPFVELQPWLHDALVLANLETAIATQEGHIEKWPRVLSSASVVGSVLSCLGIDAVNLANNHTFDGLASGFNKLTELLEMQGIAHFGAGRGLSAAARPLSLQSDGIKFGFLGAVDIDTCPSHIATETDYGPNLLDKERLLRQVSDLRSGYHHLIISLHWGVEFCDIPSPSQISFARSLVDHGASLVVGHHAHVIQGAEHHGDGAIAYGIGNATTSDFVRSGLTEIRQTKRSRSSLILRAVFSRTRLENVALVPIRCDQARIFANDPAARRFLEKANRRLARGVSEARWRRRRLLEDVILRTLKKLHPSVVRSLQWHHVRKLFANFRSAIRGLGPT